MVAVLVPDLAQGAMPQPRQKWSVKLPDRVDGSLIAYPSQHPNSVVLACGGHVFRISAQGKILFHQTVGPEAGRGGIYEPVAADLDGDGKEELIAGHKSGLVCALDGDTGRILWQYDHGGSMDSWEMAIAGDLDGDGRPEILVSNQEGWIVCLNHQGHLLWRSRVETWRVSTPCVADINNDGQPEIVYGSATRHLIALDATGRLLWDRFQPPLFLDRTMPLVADLDGDGRAEIYSLSSMVAPDTGLLSVNGADGSLRWTAPKYSKAYMGRSLLPLGDGTMGILACDKGNYLSAYDAHGKQRWRASIAGRGIWTPPAVADIDGDGSPEIITGVRGGGWSVLSQQGKLLGTYDASGGHFSASLVADIDGDGVLEVVNAASSGEVRAYTFGGPARPGAVVSGDWRGPGYPLRKRGDAAPVPAQATPMTLVEDLPQLRYGDNPLAAQFPACPGRAVLEIATTAPDGVRHIQGFRVDAGTTSTRVRLPVVLAGRYEVALRLVDVDHGKLVGTQSLNQEVYDPAAGLVAAKDAAKAALAAIGQRQPSSPSCALMLAQLEAGLQARCNLLVARIHSAANLSTSERDALAQDAADFLTSLRRADSLGALLEKEVAAEKTASFALWQDANPWDNRDPRDEIPSDLQSQSVHAWAFGNEIESVAINTINLSPEPLTLRIEPGQITRAGQKLATPALADVAHLHRVVWLPSNTKELVPDLLPKIAEGGLVDIAPGQVQQIWINLHTAGLEPGVYQLSWPIRSLDSAATSRTLSIELKVSSVALPQKSRFLAGFWASNSLGGIDAVPDLNEHLQTLWYGVPQPPARANAKGELVGAIDWSAHDAVIGRARQVMKILYSGEPPAPSFPPGVQVTEELRRTGQRNYFRTLVEHLKKFGLDHTNVVFYVEDETGLHGTNENYMRGARRNRAIDPKVQNYADPCEAISLEMIREMEPLTDVWQPSMDNLEFFGSSLVTAMRGNGHSTIGCYTPPGNCRVVRPLGFYRAQPWLARHWGIEGGGWWVYSSTDLWMTGPNREPDFGAVVSDGRWLVDSRRWEAMRDGIEDFNAMALLTDWANARGDQAARDVLREAVAYVAGRALTGTPREATDYDLDYTTLMRHRARIREALERLQKTAAK